MKTNTSPLQRPQDKKCFPSVCSQSLTSDLSPEGLSLASVRTDQVSDVNTPERLQDLKDLDDRIQMLKML